MTPDIDDLLVPRPHQVVARDAILAARAAGRPGFLLGDLTGLGKTLSVWSAIAAMPETDVLIVAPKGALPQWRRTIAHSGLAAKDVTLINYERSKSLLALPSKSGRTSTRARNNELARAGVLRRTWRLVVFDESHRLRNPYAQQTMSCQQVAAAAAFVVYVSATAGQSPHELPYLGRLIGTAAGQPCETLADYRALMRRLGIGGAKGRWTNWRWDPNERDRAAMADLLYRGRNAIGLRRRPEEIAGWPEVQRELGATALSTAERRLYDATWREFRREFGLLGGSARRPVGWAADLRFRQKASLLRVAGTADAAEDLLAGGLQVAVSVVYLETGALMAETLRGRGWRVGTIDGRNTADANEAERVAFQTGELDAIVFTVTESISLHAGEMAGGERPRALMVHDMRHSAIQLAQVERALPSGWAEGRGLLSLRGGDGRRAHRRHRRGPHGRHGRDGGRRNRRHRGHRGANLRGRGAALTRRQNRCNRAEAHSHDRDPTMIRILIAAALFLPASLALAQTPAPAGGPGEFEMSCAQFRHYSDGSWTSARPMTLRPASGPIPLKPSFHFKTGTLFAGFDLAAALDGACQ